VLFFNSDLRSVFVLCGSVAIAVTVVLSIAAAVSSRPGRQHTVRVAAHAAIPAFVLAIGAVLALDFLQREFKIIGFVGDDAAEVLVALLCTSLFVLIALRRWRRRDDDVARRVRRLALAVSPVCAVLVAGSVAAAHLSGAGKVREPRHVVLVVLDAWPASNFLHTYDPSVPRRPVDDLFQKALVFRNMHTNTVWTFGYFDALYRGAVRYDPGGRARLHRRVERDGAGQAPWALLPSLQDLGVKTRWVAYHRTGIPESHGVTRYRGFRSVFLTQRHARFLHALGIDYHVILPNPTVRRAIATPRRRLLYDALNTGERFEDELHGALLPEIRSLRRRSGRSFLVYHGRWPAGPFSLPAAWDEPAPATEREQLNAAIKARNNRYREDEEWYAEELRAKTRHHMDLLGEKIVRLVADMEREGLLEHTLLIFTADHGCMFERGRFWYAYHPDEEVARVPLVVFGAGRSGVDDAFRETVDLPFTISEFFGGTTRVSPRACSLFRPAEKPFTASITRRSGQNREWFLSLYAPEGKYRFNLEPGGAGESVLTAPGATADSVVAAGDEVLARAAPMLREAIAEYGLRADELHPRYHALLPAAR